MTVEPNALESASATIRPDETHLSYKKHAGHLTITTQKGTRSS